MNSSEVLGIFLHQVKRSLSYFLNARQKRLVNQGSNLIPPISLSFLLKTFGGAIQRHPIHRGN